MEFYPIEDINAATVDALLSVYKETMDKMVEKYENENGSCGDEAKTTMEQEFADFIADFAAQDGRHIFALRDGDTMAAALRVIEMAQGGWYLEALETAPEYRGRGCARRLLLETVRCLKALSAHTIVSVVRRENAASRAVHEACGFEDTGRVARDMEGTPLEDCMIYRFSCADELFEKKR